MNGDGARHTLLLRLAGPMQSWGTTSRYIDRDTGFEPSKSGVLGLVCAALGWPRTRSTNDLARLRMGVRVDREGTPAVDYQTAGGSSRQDDFGVPIAEYVENSTKTGQRKTVQSWRHYLADASFLVGLEGRDADLTILRGVDDALSRPHWPLCLGRKSYPPGEPVGGLGVRERSALLSALQAEAWPGRTGRLRFVIERTDGEEERADQPDEGAAFEHRQFVLRHVRTYDLGRFDALPSEEVDAWG